MVRHPIAIAGRVRESEMCGHTMVQHDPDEGRFLFAHASALKSTHDVRRGRTWEAIQYLERVEPMPVSPISDAAAKAGRKVLSFRVGYPVAHEYAGGVWKREIDGGIVRWMRSVCTVCAVAGMLLLVFITQGEEAAENACILYALVRNTTIETTPAVVKAWGSDAVDSYRVVTEDLSTYQNGALAWLDDTFFDMNGMSG